MKSLIWNRFSIVACTIAILLSSISFTSCKKDDSIAVASVSLDKTSLSLVEGETATLTATVLPEDASNKDLIWESDKEDVASVENGTVTAIAEGSATITVRTADGGKTATCKVSVEKKTIAVASVSLDKTSLSLVEGETATLTATVLPEDASNKNLIWESDKEGVASVENGTVSAIAEGSATITVRTADGGKTATCKVSVVNGINGHGYVDLGLPSGTKWATMNVGAASPEEYGDYYAWGETETKSEYEWSTYMGMSSWGDFGTSKDPLKNYVCNGKSIAGTEYDVAHVKWGGTWKMPTLDQIIELWNSDYCTTTWTYNYNGTGVVGRIITSKVAGYEGNSIFLPAAGYRSGSSLYDCRHHGIFWSAMPNSDHANCAYGLYFQSGYIDHYYSVRSYGQSVRPVSE